MIIVRLAGGLGNQMFQYAAGRRLAVTLGVPLKLDLSSFRHDPRRKYHLDGFDIQAELAAEDEVKQLAYVRQPSWQKLLGSLTGKTPRRAASHVAERSFRFDPSILELDDGVYLDGYWQSEKYFADIRELLLLDFRVKSPMTDENAVLAEELREVEAVSVHVRRGDYADDPSVRAVHGLCPSAYYQTCAQAVLDRYGKALFYVFSDEPDWVRAHLSLPGKMTVVDWNCPERAHEDLRLMSLCSHHIIANSSLSWWGAWLRQDADGIVYAPEPWFAHSDNDTSDLLPEAWLRQESDPSNEE